MTSLAATVWTDYVCPWAHAGRAHTTWLRSRGVHVDLRTFELHPGTPLDGVTLEPGRRLDRLYDRLQPIAAELGVPFSKPPRTQNTHLALDLVETVRELVPDRVHDLDHVVDWHYWVDGGAIDDPSELRELVRSLRLDPGLVDRAVDDDGTARRRSREAALDVGVAGTPAWKVGELVIPGLQETATFQRWLERLIARHDG